VTTYMYSWWFDEKRQSYWDSATIPMGIYVDIFSNGRPNNAIFVLAEDEERAYNIGRSFMFAGDRSFCRKLKNFD